MKKVMCKYWIVNNDEEKQKVLELINVKSIIDVGQSYPFIIGKEGNDNFQCKAGLHPIESFINGDTEYVYELQAF